VVVSHNVPSVTAVLSVIIIIRDVNTTLNNFLGTSISSAVTGASWNTAGDTGGTLLQCDWMIFNSNAEVTITGDSSTECNYPVTGGNGCRIAVTSTTISGQTGWHSSNALCYSKGNERYK